MNGLSFGPGQDISLQRTPHAFSTLVIFLAPVVSAAVGFRAMEPR